MNVQSGTLNLSGGGTDVGAIYRAPARSNSAAARARWMPHSSIRATRPSAAGTTTVNGGTGTGLLTVTGGTATFGTGGQTVTTGALTQTGGELNGSGTLTVTGRSSLYGRDAERFWDDECAGRGGRSAAPAPTILGWTAGGRCSWAAPARRRAGRMGHRYDRSERDQSEHRLSDAGSGIADDRERSDVQRPDDDEHWADDLGQQPCSSDTGSPTRR